MNAWRELAHDRYQERSTANAAPDRDAFVGGPLGRWGATFPVIYLGRPPDSVTVEAYRHLVESPGIPARAVKPRVFYTVTVKMNSILDFTDEVTRELVGLTDSDLRSPVGEYEACQEVARAARQLELHGILAPAATGLGETLALFAQRIDVTERPILVDESLWTTLPADPRVPRAVPQVEKDGA